MTINLNLVTEIKNPTMVIIRGIVGCLLYHKITHVTEYFYNKSGTNYEKIPLVSIPSHSPQPANFKQLGKIIVSRGHQHPTTKELPKRILLCALSSGLIWLISKHSSQSTKMDRVASIIPMLVFALIDMALDSTLTMRNKKCVLLNDKEVEARKIETRGIKECKDSVSTYFNWYTSPQSITGTSITPEDYE